jgi:hypothetical protein
MGVMAQIATCRHEDLPPVTDRAIGMPVQKSPGILLNTHTRPILNESAIHRFRQQGSLMRIQAFLNVGDLEDFQHSILKGLNCIHLRRLAYNAMVIRLSKGQDAIALFLDLSNAFGQLDRALLGAQARHDTMLQWAYQQAMKLYGSLEVYLQTEEGMTPPYPVEGGAIQGGGMDPFWYVWNTKLLANAIRQQTEGISLSMWDGPLTLQAQAVVDDTTIWATDIPKLQRDATKVVDSIDKLNGKCNPNKFDLLHIRSREGKLEGVRSHITLGEESIQSAGTTTYVRCLGGNLNPTYGGLKDVKDLRKRAKQITVALAAHCPSLAIIMMVVEGL